MSYTIEEFDVVKTKVLKYVIYKKRTENEVCEELEIDEILSNSGSTLYNQVKLPKVVE